MTGLVISDPPPGVRRQRRFVATGRVEQVLQRNFARALARGAPRLAHEALDVGAGAAAGGKRRRPQVDAREIDTEVQAEDADQRRHVGQGDFDMAVKPSGADKRRVKTGRKVAGRRCTTTPSRRSKSVELFKKCS